MSDHRPSPGELIGVVAEFILGTARPALEGHARFEALIALRLLQIAVADYEFGPDARERQRERLEALLGHPGDLESLEEQLVRKIREGDLDGDERAELLEVLRAGAREQVAIANPAYLREN
ncbi:MAG: hypothetical protein IT199_01425 [Solirubrobacterales bacterium]|nr:hypothetical protein [Solirubrobacterales bacterium]